jgi:hypothetical protein
VVQAVPNGGAVTRVILPTPLTIILIVGALITDHWTQWVLLVVAAFLELGVEFASRETPPTP